MNQFKKADCCLCVMRFYLPLPIASVMEAEMAKLARVAPKITLPLGAVSIIFQKLLIVVLTVVFKMKKYF